MEQTKEMDRLERLIKKYGPHSCGIYDIRNVDGDIEWMISEIERLRKALVEYGQHNFDCGLNIDGYIEAVCTCGFLQVLKETR